MDEMEDEFGNTMSQVIEEVYKYYINCLLNKNYNMKFFLSKICINNFICKVILYFNFISLIFYSFSQFLCN